jgi:hypothetical protein
LQIWHSHIRGKLTQRLVEVIHLSQDAGDDDDDEDISGRMGKLIVTVECHLQCCAKRLDSHDGDGAGGGADGEVNERILATIFGRNFVDHEDGENGNEAAIYEETFERASQQDCSWNRLLGVAELHTWLDCEMQNLVD